LIEYSQGGVVEPRKESEVEDSANALLDLSRKVEDKARGVGNIPGRRVLVHDLEFCERLVEGEDGDRMVRQSESGAA